MEDSVDKKTQHWVSTTSMFNIIKSIYMYAFISTFHSVFNQTLYLRCPSNPNLMLMQMPSPIVRSKCHAPTLDP